MFAALVLAVEKCVPEVTTALAEAIKSSLMSSSQMAISAQFSR